MFPALCRQDAAGPVPSLREPGVKPFEISVVLAMALGAGVPAAEPPAETRLFELREYHAAPGRIDELHARFRTHTVNLLEKHGITNVAYLASADGGDDVLRVILAYPDAAARERSWASFVTDPDWQQARRVSDARGRLVEKIRELPLTPTADCPRVTTTPAAEGWVYEIQTSPISLQPIGRNQEAPRPASEKVIGSWTANGRHPSDGAMSVRLVARRVVASASPTRETFFRGPVEPNPNVRPAVATAPQVKEPLIQSLTVVPTDYSPIK
jgi:hypothetical protein